MTLEIESRQDMLSVDEHRDTLTNIAQTAVEMAAARSDIGIFLLLTDEAEIRQINRDHRHVDAVTDVLSFPMLELKPHMPFSYTQADIDPQSHEIFLGDIILCLPRAAQQADEYGHALWREIGYLLVHAMLHLLGYEHTEQTDRQEMRQMEERILTRLQLLREMGDHDGAS